LPRPDAILVQAPPTVPTLVIAAILRARRGARLVVDWHNFSYSQLALRLGPEHVAVRSSRWLEHRLAPLADANLCVSSAMAERLRQWGARDPTVLYDRPAAVFSPTPAAERDSLLRRLAAEIDLPELAESGASRPALLVSSTSWTADEDFTPLLEAVDSLRRIDDAAMPRLAVLVTGRGPLRELWETRFREIDSERIRLRTAWLAPEDYPRLLGAADLGLCFHRSSSGLDLPMKIADMFGAGLPVCALDDGGCLPEMVRPDVDARLFTDADGLAAALADLVGGANGATPALDRLRTGALAVAAGPRWDDAWRAHAAPLLLGEPR
jgi:beta-1,4-mannosyltransferase